MIINEFLKRPLVWNTNRILSGYRVYHFLQKRYGKNIHIFIITERIGDVIACLQWFKYYCDKKNIFKGVFVGNSKVLGVIKHLYPEIKAYYVPISDDKKMDLIRLYDFAEKESFNFNMSLLGDLDPRCNRSRIKLLKSIPSKELLQIDESMIIGPDLNNVLGNNERRFRKVGVKNNKTVIITPFSDYCRPLQPLFWQMLIRELKYRGYKVIVLSEKNSFESEFMICTFNFTYLDFVPLIEYAGHFIGLRNSLCNIASYANCNKVILYPKEPTKLDTVIERTDIEFFNLENVGLEATATEITVPFGRDLFNWEPETELFDVRIKEDKEVMKNILKQFPTLNRG